MGILSTAKKVGKAVLKFVTTPVPVTLVDILCGELLIGVGVLLNESLHDMEHTAYKAGVEAGMNTTNSAYDLAATVCRKTLEEMEDDCDD